MRRSRVLVGFMIAAVLLGVLVGGSGVSWGQGFSGAESTRVWKVDPLGVSPFLTGTYRAPTAQGVLQSEITLQNPTKNKQAALIIYYDAAEKFLACDVKVLTTHDMETFSPPAANNLSPAGSMANVIGAFEVVSTAARNIIFKGFRPHGYNSAYGPSTTRTFQTESLHDGLVGNVRIITLATSTTAPKIFERLPLHQVNFRYFTPPANTGEFPSQQTRFRDCVCKKVPTNDTGIFDFIPGVNCAS
jgi:hypothetical protein